MTGVQTCALPIWSEHLAQLVTSCSSVDWRQAITLTRPNISPLGTDVSAARLGSIVRATSFCLVFGVSQATYAQRPGRISGIARTVDEVPVPGARITLQPSGRTTVSDVDGTFAFERVGDGQYQLVGVRIGFRPTSASVSSASGTVALVFVPIPTFLDSVLVRGSPSRRVPFRVVVRAGGESAVPGALVELLGDTLAVRTDANGRTPPLLVAPGTAVVRIRKIGLSAALRTLRVLGAREDTVDLSPIPSTLSAAEILATSGFGRDTFVFRDFAARLRWRGASSGVVSREELDAQGRASLCDVLPFTPTGVRLGFPAAMPCGAVAVLINGERETCTPLSSFLADEVEAVEY